MTLESARVQMLQICALHVHTVFFEVQAYGIAFCRNSADSLTSQVIVVTIRGKIGRCQKQK